ncbi:MAG: SusC/RagA family TonB-linked outer membrane protein [Bacteroidales bacterium]|jgi:TonB-linked SusC/RagA family outer membrane protein
MKKFLITCERNLKEFFSRKKIRVIKILLFLCFFTVFQLFTTKTYSQLKKLSLDLENIKIADALREIESQSEFYFLYSPKLIDVDKAVTISAQQESLTNILSDIFDNKIDFSVYDRQIVLSPKNELFDGKEIFQQVVSGKVTDKSGTPVVGASVVVPGTTIGTLTDNNGSFSLAVPQGATTLSISFVGMEVQTVPIENRTVFDIVLETASIQMDEVVVTALGIKREARSIGYSATSVDAVDIVSTTNLNVGNALLGKVAGLNVSVPATGVGGSSKIRIRGQSSFGGNNSPLIVINGVPLDNQAGISNFDNDSFSDLGDGMQSINSEDIESMTVLKGASAAALYGYRAKDGVILITTKSGSGTQGIGVEVSSNFTADQALDFSDYQYEYGAGEYGKRIESVTEARGTGIWSFGPKFDGEPIWCIDGKQHPYLPFKDRVKAFYRTGQTFTNTLALSGGDNKGSFRLATTNTDAKNIVPNSSFNKKIMDLALNYKLGEKLTVSSNINYSIENTLNPPTYMGQRFNVNLTVRTLATSYDPTWLADVYETEEGNELLISRFKDRTNPYWTINKRFEERQRHRVYGNVTLRYDIAPWLYAQGRIVQDFYTMKHERNTPTGSAFLAMPVSGFNGSFYQGKNDFFEYNADFLIGANKTFGDLDISGTMGGNTMNQKRESLSTSVTNFYIRDLYSISNGQTKSPSYSLSEKRVNSLYGTLDFGFRDYLYLNFTARNDWFSTLNPKSNSYLYPSVSSSFLFSEVFANLMPSWFTYGKLRASYAEVGGDTEPYTNVLYYELSNNEFNGIPIGGITSMGSGGTLVSTGVAPNATLKPLKIKEAEVGMELIFFNRRLTLDVAAYRKNTVDEILNVDISQASGFSQTKVNVGRLRNQGLEILLGFVPIRSDDFTWETNINHTWNESEVLELAGGQNRIDVGSYTWLGRLSHEVGKPMASMRGYDYRRDDQGRIITINGRFQQGPMTTFGSAIPRHTGAILNTFTYKKIRIFAQIDYKAGKDFVITSNTSYNAYREGLAKQSLVGREGGVIFDGVNLDGTPNEIPVEAESFYTDYSGKRIATPHIQPADFIRWRTIRLDYDLSSYVRNSFIRGMTVSASINNVLMIKKYIDNLDPECVPSVSDNMAGIEDGGQLPTVRTYGLKLNVRF